MRTLDTKFISANAAIILGSTPISYLKTAKLRGSLFEDAADADTVSSVHTEFYVDHTEPRAALRRWREREGSDIRWPLGSLLDGHEYLMLVPLKE